LKKPEKPSLIDWSSCADFTYSKSSYLNHREIRQLDLLKRAQIQVLTDLGALAQVLSWFDQFSHPPIPHVVWLQCQLILAEGFTNAVRHAHRDCSPDTPIEIEVTMLSDALEIRIWDQGEPFDLETKLATMPKGMDKHAEGGRGLKLMQRMSDVLKYSRTDDQRNCLLAVKRYTLENEANPE
jgi:serine/threonine-protein kinase RsbW